MEAASRVCEMKKSEWEKQFITLALSMAKQGIGRQVMKWTWMSIDNKKAAMFVFLYSSRRSMRKGIERYVKRNCLGGIRKNYSGAILSNCLSLTNATLEGEKGWHIASIFLNRQDYKPKYLIHELTHALDHFKEGGRLVDHTDKDEALALTMEGMYALTTEWLGR